MKKIFKETGIADIKRKEKYGIFRIASTDMKVTKLATLNKYISQTENV